MNYVFTNRSDLYIIMEYEIERFLYAPLAQLDRVTHYECGGLGFESLMARQNESTYEVGAFIFVCIE